MNANILKPATSFVTRKKLTRTPATKQNQKMAEFLDSHDFSFRIDRKTENLKCKLTKKNI